MRHQSYPLDAFTGAAEMIFRLIHQSARENARRAISEAPDGWECVVRKPKSKRSLQQNSLFHQWMNTVSLQYAEATGKFYPPAHWKEYFKALFLGEEAIEVNGKVISRQRKTSELDVPEMSAFMEKVDHYCGSELRIYLPSPNMPSEEI